MLYDDMLKLEQNQEITIHSNLPQKLRSVATKHRTIKYSSKVSPN